MLAATIDSNHVCPMCTGNVPHVGGPVTDSPSVHEVYIGNKLAATVGSTCKCEGPSDTIMSGSSTVFISGQPAARMTSTTVHGGIIVIGNTANVFIGGATIEDSALKKAFRKTLSGSELIDIHERESKINEELWKFAVYSIGVAAIIAVKNVGNPIGIAEDIAKASMGDEVMEELKLMDDLFKGDFDKVGQAMAKMSGEMVVEKKLGEFYDALGKNADKFDQSVYQASEEFWSQMIETYGTDPLFEEPNGILNIPSKDEEE